MTDSDKYLVVVSVLEGRKFPRRANCSILVEARFDGELLTTDPVDHTDNPDFTQELAWELDKKSLHQHRLQRSSVKVQLYSLDTSNSVREQIGYVVLDLRSAPSQSEPKWLPILQCKYRRTKPEIHLSLYIDDEKKSESVNNNVKEVKPTSLASPVKRAGKVDQSSIQQLKPVLNDTDGYYQIGPDNDNCEKFVLSVTVAFATNLIQLIPSNVPLPSTGYYFYYSLLGNDITNEVFHDLLNPSFPAERASVRLSATLDALRLFLSHQSGLQIHLCCGDQSLGSCEVSINNLLKKGSKEIYMKPLAVEGAFRLVAPKSAKLIVPPVESEDEKPMVGVSIVLRVESHLPHSVNKSPQKEIPSSVGIPAAQESVKKQEQDSRGVYNMAAVNSRVSPLEKTATAAQVTSAAKTSAAEKSATAEKFSTAAKSAAAAVVPLDGSYTETLDHQYDNNSVDDDVSKSGTNSKVIDERQERLRDDSDADIISNPATRLSGEVDAPEPASSHTQGEESESITQRYLAIPEQPHHYTVSVDVRSVKNLNIQYPIHIFLRYTYMFFGSTTPILTHPPVEARRGMEVLLPQSFCVFDFATTFNQMQDTFHRVPLMVEVWERSQELSQNICLGIASIALSSVIKASKSTTVHSSGANGTRQAWSDWIPIKDNNSKKSQIGILQVLLTLEDWGPINQQTIITAISSPSVQFQQINKQVTVNELSEPHTTGSRISSRETPEYKVALELEMWKQQQENLFIEQLKVKEKQSMKALAEEWKRNDKERELLVKKRMAEYQELEEQLRNTLSDLEKRERGLADNEKNVLQHRQELQREHERKMKELAEASRRMKDDFDYQLALQKRKVEELEAALVRIKQLLAESETRNRQQAKEFSTYREQLNNKPEVKLQSEINLIMLEKVELERKLDSAVKSKVHYKQQWSRALKELARLKQKEQAQAHAQLKKQQQELEQMRLRVLATEEKEAVKLERQELEQLKNELNTLKGSEFNRSDQSRHSKQPEYNRPSDVLHHVDAEIDDDDDDDDDGHIARLIEERDTLLRTGVYTPEDRIIAELDRQIREAIAIRTSENTKLRMHT